MALWSERRRLAEQSEREAAGENLWTTELDSQLRAKLWHLVTLCASPETYGVWPAFAERVRLIIQTSIGMVSAPTIDAVLVGAAGQDTDLTLSYIEAIDRALQQFHRRPPAHTRPSDFGAATWRKVVPELLNSHRAAYKFIDGDVIPLSSEEMFVSVIEPTIMLLRGRPELERANIAYRKAIKEIQRADAADAITDAGTALQEALEALGCEGNALGDLIKNARKRGLLRSHDATLTAGIERFLHWVSADRSETGDAHKADEADLDDAWLMVHVVGALILRLAGSPRGEAAG